MTVKNKKVPNENFIIQYIQYFLLTKQTTFSGPFLAPVWILVQDSGPETDQKRSLPDLGLQRHFYERSGQEDITYPLSLTGLYLIEFFLFWVFAELGEAVNASEK